MSIREFIFTGVIVGILAAFTIIQKKLKSELPFDSTTNSTDDSLE